MKTEHWTGSDDEGGCDLLVNVGTPEADLNRDKVVQIVRDMGETVTLCCTIEGDDWEDCRKKYAEHLSWGDIPGTPVGGNLTRE